MIKSEKSDEPLAEDESKHSFRLKPGLCNSSSTEGCFKGLKLKVHMQGMTHLLLHGTERVSGVSSGWIRQLQHFTDDSEILERCVQLLRVRCRFTGHHLLRLQLRRQEHWTQRLLVNTETSVQHKPEPAEHSQTIFRCSSVCFRCPSANRDARPSYGQHRSFSSLPVSSMHRSGSSAANTISVTESLNECALKTSSQSWVCVCLSPVMSGSWVCVSVTCDEQLLSVCVCVCVRERVCVCHLWWTAPGCVCVCVTCDERLLSECVCVWESVWVCVSLVMSGSWVCVCVYVTCDERHLCVCVCVCHLWWAAPEWVCVCVTPVMSGSWVCGCVCVCKCVCVSHL